MTAILQALNAGHSTQKILQFLSRNNPELAAKISSALEAGHTIDHVLNFLSRNEKKLGKLIPEKKEVANPFRQAQTSIHPAISGAGKALGIGAAALGGGYALSRALPAIVAQPAANPVVQNALSRALPSSLQPTANATTPTYISPSSNVSAQGLNTPMSQPQTTPAVSQSKIPSQQPPVSPSIAQPPQVAQPERITINPKDFLEKAGVLKEVENGLKAKNSPEAIAASLGLKKGPGKLKAEIDPELQKNIEEYAKEFNSEKETQNIANTFEEMGKGASENLYKGLFDALQKGSKTFAGIKDPALEKARPAFERGEIKSPEDLKKFLNQPKIEAKSIVASPQGVGEIQAIRGKEAIVDIDGKKHKVNVDEIEPSLFSDEDIANAYDTIMAKTPEEHRSGYIQWAGYDEDRNVLGYIPRGGKYEEITNISPEEAQKVKEGKGIARTSGENREGLWVMGEDTRGGIISQIIWDRRKKKEAGEKEQLSLFEIPKKEKEDKGMKPLFDELAYARNLSRERDRKKKEEERERKKKEKDEAKKRKK